MSFFDGLRHRVHVLLRGERYARDVARELRFHTELDALAKSSEGLSRVEAELAARRTLGNATYYREEVRRMTLQRFVDHARQDLRYASRGLKREPLFAAMVIATIALGVGVNTALFAVLDRIFLQSPTGVAAPNDVRRLYIDARDDGATRMVYDGYPYPQFHAIRAAVDSSIPLAGYTEPDSTSLVRGDLRIPIRRSRVTSEYFSSLGVRPQRGRFFIDEENRIETPTPVAVLSDAAWRRVFDGDPTVLGRTISIDFRPFTVVGIAPPGFTGVDLDAVDIWVPANTYPARRPDRTWYETFQSSFRIVASEALQLSADSVISSATPCRSSTCRARRAAHPASPTWVSTTGSSAWVWAAARSRSHRGCRCSSRPVTSRRVSARAGLHSRSIFRSASPSASGG